MTASGTYVQHVLLDDGVHDDGHQHVEEDGGQVLDAMVEVVHGRLVRTFSGEKKVKRKTPETQN